MRRLLRKLFVLGVFLGYDLDTSFGQRICVKDELGNPRYMNPGTAKIYADRLEATKWGFPV